MKKVIMKKVMFAIVRSEDNVFIIGEAWDEEIKYHFKNFKLNGIITSNPNDILKFFKLNICTPEFHENDTYSCIEYKHQKEYLKSEILEFYNK